MQHGGDDLGFWRWVATAAVGLLTGAVGWAWASRGVLEDLRAADRKAVDDVKAIKVAMAACQATFIGSMIDKKQGEEALKHAEQMAEIRTNMAVMVAMQGEMKEDIKDIFARLNRRSDDRKCGDERRDG